MEIELVIGDHCFKLDLKLSALVERLAKWKLTWCLALELALLSGASAWRAPGKCPSAKSLIGDNLLQSKCLNACVLLWAHPFVSVCVSTLYEGCILTHTFKQLRMYALTEEISAELSLNLALQSCKFSRNTKAPPNPINQQLATWNSKKVSISWGMCRPHANCRLSKKLIQIFATNCKTSTKNSSNLNAVIRNVCEVCCKI